MEFLIPRYQDIVDILFIAFLIYQALLIVRKSGGYQVLWGLLFCSCPLYCSDNIQS